MRLVVVGGGIAGLSAAYEASVAGADVVILEASERLGGKVWTETVDGVPLEWGPDSFLAAKPAGRELAEELGLGADLVAPGPAAGRAYMLLHGRLRPFPRGTVMGVPAGPGALAGAVRAGILSPFGAARAALEPLLPRGRVDADTATVADVVGRRLGRQAARRLVEPLVQGVFGAPAGDVSLAAALPYARDGRSLVLASARARRTGTGGPVFLSIRGGMERLVDELAAVLPDVRTDVATASIRRRGDGYVVIAPDAEQPADAVVLAVPAPAAAELLAEIAPAGSAALSGVRYSSSAVVQLGYPVGSLGRPMDGSGYLVAPEEHAVTAAVSWLPSKWPHLFEGAGRDWLRAVATSPRGLALTDDELAGRVADEVGAVMAVRQPPDRVLVRRWRDALPVFSSGHRSRVAAALGALPPGVALAGAFLEGIGIPDCVRTGRDAARHLVRPPASH